MFELQVVSMSFVHILSLMAAVELGKKIQSGEVTAREAALASLDRIKESEDTLNSFVTVLREDTILARADDVQKKIELVKCFGNHVSSVFLLRRIC